MQDIIFGEPICVDGLQPDWMGDGQKYRVEGGWMDKMIFFNDKSTGLADANDYLNRYESEKKQHWSDINYISMPINSLVG